MSNKRDNQSTRNESKDDPDTRNHEAKLRQTDLPILEKAGLIAFDRENGEIKRGPSFEKIEPLLDELEESDDK